MARELKSDAESIKRREATQRLRARKALVEQGLPIPPELEKRPTRKSELSDEERRKRSLAASARYKQQHSADVSEATRVRKERNREIVLEVKRDLCQDCDHSFPPVCMDFDHREGEEKKHGGVAGLVARGCSVESLLAEIAKCDLVCANCHRIRTAKRAGWTDVLHEPMKEENE